MAQLQEILDDLRAGKMIILVDSEDRENEGDLICAAEYITEDHISFMARFGRGLICSPITSTRAQELDLQLMPKRNTSKFQHCNFTYSVDAKEHISTGISAHDRAETIRILSLKKVTSSMLSTPGHVFPLIAQDGGVLTRPGHTEGTLDLLKLAGLTPAGALCEIMGDDGTMLRGKQLERFAKKHKLKIYAISDLIRYRKMRESTVEKAAESRLPTQYGEFRIIVYKGVSDKKEHVVLLKGKPKKNNSFLVRIHSECLTGDIFCSTRCDCNGQLHAALDQIRTNTSGALIYLRQEGRGIGLVNKLKAYTLQDAGFDTVEANIELGFKADMREYQVAADILKDLNIQAVDLMTNNPQKISEIEDSGIRVTKRVPLSVANMTDMQLGYAEVKKKKMGHLFP